MRISKEDLEYFVFRAEHNGYSCCITQVIKFILQCGDSPEELIKEFDITRESLSQDMSDKELFEIDLDYKNWNNATRKIWNRKTKSKK